MWKKFLFFFLLTLLLASTAAASPRYTFSLTEPAYSEELRFEDDRIAIVFTLKPKGNYYEYPLELTNKTGQPIKIDWSQAAIIDPDGRSHRVGRSAAPALTGTQPENLSPTTIPPQAFVAEAIFCSDDALSVGGLARVYTTYLYPRTYQEAKKLIGSSRKIFLPLEINGETVYYTFAITVENVAIN